MHCFNLKNRLGFSFIELFIVMALIGTMIALVMPSFTSSIPYFKLRGASRRLTSHLRLARQVAVGQRSTTRVEIITGGYPSYKLFSSLSDTIYIKSPLTHREIFVDFQSDRDLRGVAIDSVRAPDGSPVNTIYFYSLGDASGGTIYLSCDGLTKSIEVNLVTGKVRLL